MEQSSPGLSNFMNDMGMSHGRNEPSDMRSQPEEFQRSSAPPPRPPPPMRNEMKGPSNIDSLLSNLGKSSAKNDIKVENNSTISIEDLETLSVGSRGSGKKSSKRKSDKNTISLAI